jgi:capsular polysaccharide biosynthesis protein
MRFEALLGTAVLIVGLVLCALGIRVVLSPLLYRASARIEVKHKSAPGVYDPWFIQTEFEVIQSDIILSNAIERLNLVANLDGKKVDVGEALPLLRKRLILRSFGEDILEISVIDKSPQEAARIANAIAERYCNLRTEQHLKYLDYVAKSKTTTGGDDVVSGGDTARIVAAAIPPKSSIGPSLWSGVATLLCGLAASVAGSWVIFNRWHSLAVREHA